MFWQLYWNCIKFWKPVICQLSILDSSGWAPDPLEFFPGEPALWRGVTVSGVVPIRLNPTRSGKQGIVRSWFVVCGSMACHPGIIKLHYAIFLGESNLIQVDANLEGFPLWCMVRAGKITMPVAIQGHDFSPHPAKKMGQFVEAMEMWQEVPFNKRSTFRKKGLGAWPLLCVRFLVRSGEQRAQNSRTAVAKRILWDKDSRFSNKYEHVL